MPTLPIILDDGVPIAGGDLPVTSVNDVAGEWAQEITAPANAPIRDAILAAETAMLEEWQRRASNAAALSDPLRATGIYADEIGDERGIPRSPGESDDAYVRRINATPTTVSPNDLIAAANAQLAPVSNIPARYLEQSDGWFVNIGGAAWSSHVWDGTVNATPEYPDRLYFDTTPAGLQPIPNRRPGGARIFASETPSGPSAGRYFEIRIPDLAPVDATVAALASGATVSNDTNPADGVFLSSGASTVNATFLSAVGETEQQVYDAVIGAVEALRGHSMRWTLRPDPLLKV